MNVLMLSLQALALAAYITGVVTLHRRGRPWSPWRTAAFVSGLLMLDIALVSVLASYDDDVFVAHIVQHLLLMMVGPPLLALGAPVTLVLQARPGPLRGASLVSCTGGCASSARWEFRRSRSTAPCMPTS